MNQLPKTLLAMGLAAAAFSAFISPASAQATLEAVKKRGRILCGVSPSSAGFSYADDKGVRQGFDADVCRAVSSAIFGVPDKVDFVPLNTNVRFQGLQSGEVDLLSRQTTATFSRDASLGLDFAPVVFYDGQGLMATAKLGVKSAAELSQAAICVQPGTTTQQNLEDYFKPRNIKYEAVVFENPDEWRNAFFSGRCDVITSDRSDLASVRAIANDPKQYVILPETISKEPLAPVVRQNDSNWRDIVSWTVNALIAAEEYGITKGNIDEQLKSKDPEIQRLLGVSGDLGKMLNLDNKWAYNAIKQLGNYGEIFERNLGEKTPLGLSRGPNQLWNKGGLLYSPPFR
ncbi:amino acid ABC transporter substrate-binding protein (plasmid) [Bosea sp. F3-2]|uniref:amino acid ABC transporter substrate-binding protein n=1 Tax=Bosea sp. F3-2 TaxID=2599640 RepID=UPI0011ED33C2|nr:amino acid ABC transporter substrate-binding protein [Bosea sp. F3-2]QEL27371.1 amino acid ABC transporter substrate-binding protein [Bosea sp. F3-2]